MGHLEYEGILTGWIRLCIGIVLLAAALGVVLLSAAPFIRALRWW